MSKKEQLFGVEADKERTLECLAVLGGVPFAEDPEYFWFKAAMLLGDAVAKLTSLDETKRKAVCVLAESVDWDDEFVSGLWEGALAASAIDVLKVLSTRGKAPDWLTPMSKIERKKDISKASAEEMLRLALGIKNETDVAELRESASEWLASAAGRRNMGLCQALVEIFDADPTEKPRDGSPAAVDRSGGFGGELFAFWEQRQIEQAQELGRSAELAKRRREGASPPRI